MTREEAADIVRKKWGADGQCQSCGWHSALYEMEPIIVDNSEIQEGVVWLPCRSDGGDSDSHRGVSIHLQD